MDLSDIEALDFDMEDFNDYQDNEFFDCWDGESLDMYYDDDFDPFSHIKSSNGFQIYDDDDYEKYLKKNYSDFDIEDFDIDIHKNSKTIYNL